MKTYAKTCERCGGAFETLDREKRFCCHHASGNKKHGLSFSAENDIWRQMRYRCNSPKCKHYPNYGGRGIRVCERWDSFENFLADMGPKPPGRSLERIDNNGNYEPSNCKWATKLEQSRNRRGIFTPEEDGRLRWLLVGLRSTYQEAATAMGKTKGSVQSRARRLGIPYAHLPVKITDRPGHPLRFSQEQQP